MTTPQSPNDIAAIAALAGPNCPLPTATIWCGLA